MSKKIMKWHLGIWCSLFVVTVVFIGRLDAQAEVVIGKAVTAGVRNFEHGEQVQVVEETAVIPQIIADDADHYTYLPIVFKPILLRQEQEVLTLINAHRANAGCAPLVAHKQLVQAARGHSIDMAVNDYFSHTSLDGRSPWDRMADAGYTSFSSAGENIAAGQSTTTRVVNGWMGSSGHRANILNCNFTETGIGYHYLQNDTGDTNYRHYWTQNFARP